MATIAKVKPDRKEPPDRSQDLTLTLNGNKAKIPMIAAHIQKVRRGDRGITSLNSAAPAYREER